MVLSGKQRNLKREAHERIVRLTSGRATTADAEEARLWCGHSQAHAKAFAEASQLWEQLEPAARRLAGQSAMVSVGRPRNVQGRRMMLAGGCMAAAAAYFAVRPPGALWPSLSELAAEYRTGIGQQRSVTVASGLSVEMNTRTSINVQRGDTGNHAIELVSGEVTVATAVAATNPVIILANGGRTSAASAKFDIRCDAGAASVTCLEGEVGVEFRGQVAALRKGWQVSYGEGGLGSVVTVDAAAVTAWRDGRLVYQGAPLAQVIADVNRYWPGRIILMNAELGRRPVDATLPLDHLAEIVTLLQSAYGAKVTTLPGDVVLLS